MGVSKNFVVPPNHPISIGFSIIFTIHFGGKTPPSFGLTPIWLGTDHSGAVMIPSQLRYWCVSRLPETDATASAAAASACCGRTHARKPLRCHHESLLECDFDISWGGLWSQMFREKRIKTSCSSKMILSRGIFVVKNELAQNTSHSLNATKLTKSFKI